MSTTLSTHDVDPALSLARQVLYRFAALSLLDPRAGAWEELDRLRCGTLLDDAAEIVRRDPASKAEPLGRGELPLADLDPARVLSALPATAAELNRQYESIFGLIVSGACPPYETEYINGKIYDQRAKSLDDIIGFYRAFGLQPSGTHPERHDHIILQLEFMATLLNLELRAAEEETANDDRVAVCREAEQQFFREHLAWWAPAFAHLLACEAGDRFYGQAARLLAALLAAQRARLGLPPTHDGPQPTSLARPEECEGCGLGQT